MVDDVLLQALGLFNALLALLGLAKIDLGVQGMRCSSPKRYVLGDVHLDVPQCRPQRCHLLGLDQALA
jgi:hypothetical protein